MNYNMFGNLGDYLLIYMYCVNAPVIINNLLTSIYTNKR